MIRTAMAFAALALAAITARGDAVDDLVRAEMAKRNVPGVAVAVVKGGRVEKVAGYGLANVELNVPVKAETVFQIQSITKTFTSAAILMLVEEGKVGLEDPVGKHLDGTPESWKAITIRHLLSHTSGIKDFINQPTASLRLDVSEADVLKATAPRPLNFQPGEKYAYSNTNYHLLAMVIRKLTGKGYGEFLHDRIFMPLGMADTRIVSHRDVIPNRASGYAFEGGKLRNGQFVAESILGYGGGGVVSTAPDMAKWAIAAAGGKILKKETFERAWSAEKLTGGSASQYGLGWGLGGASEHRFVGHGGAHMTGFTSNLTIFRDDGISVVVLTNAGHANPGNIARQIAAVYEPALAPPRRKAIEDKEPNVTERVRQIGERFREGQARAEDFTPVLWALLSPQLKDLQAAGRGDGEFNSIELLSRSASGEEKTYQYRMTFANRVHLVRVTINGEGKISGLWAEEE